MKYLLAFALGCVLALSLGFVVQTKASFEYRVVLALDLRKDSAQINELASQGWELFLVEPTLSQGTNYGKADLYFRRTR